jgi:hypothetical protein
VDERERAEWEAEYREHAAIDWETPNEENGYWDKGRRSSAWWVHARKRSAVEVAVYRLVSAKVPLYFPLPRRNPLQGWLTDEQWREVRSRAHAIHVERAEWLLESGYKYAKFLGGKDLDSARRNAERNRLEEYIAAARDAALIFHRLGEALKRERERHTDNVASMSRETRHA